MTKKKTKKRRREEDWIEQNRIRSRSGRPQEKGSCRPG